MKKLTLGQMKVLLIVSVATRTPLTKAEQISLRVAREKLQDGVYQESISRAQTARQGEEPKW